MKGPVRDSSTFTFNATAKTVTFSSPIPSSQQQILAVLNVTRNAWLYLPTNAAYGGTWASPVLTVTASTTGHANGDVLQILVDDGLASTAITAANLPLPTGASTSALQTTGNTSLSSIDAKLPALASGRVPVDIGSASVSIGASVEVSNDAGNPLPVSGNVSITGTAAVTGPLTDTQLRATALPVSADSLPLPTGAATSAKQPALGTAGTPSTDVITVQGSANGTALPVAPNVQLGNGAISATTQRVTLASDSPGIANLSSIAGLSIPAHDFIALSYTGADLTGVVYKTGGSGGTTVGTLTLAYSSGALVSVTKS
jgi:hypothetical protein